jgi:DNA polymerase-4
VQQADVRRLAALLGGPAAAALQRLSRGEDDRALELDGEELTISREHTFLEDCRAAETLACVLSDLADDVGRRLRAAGKYAGLIRLKLRWKNFQTITRQQPLDPPACDDLRLRAAARRLLAAEQLVAPVRLIGCGVGKLTRGPAGQLALFDANAGAPQRVEALSSAVDRIRRQFGATAIRRADATPPAPAGRRKHLTDRPPRRPTTASPAPAG